MGALASLTTELLWRHGLVAVPLILFVAAVVRWIPCRPATRHTLWLVVLLWLIGAPFLPPAPAFFKRAVPLADSGLNSINRRPTTSRTEDVRQEHPDKAKKKRNARGRTSPPHRRGSAMPTTEVSAGKNKFTPSDHKGVGSAAIVGRRRRNSRVAPLPTTVGRVQRDSLAPSFYESTVTTLDRSFSIQPARDTEEASTDGTKGETTVSASAVDTPVDEIGIALVAQPEAPPPRAILVDRVGKGQGWFVVPSAVFKALGGLPPLPARWWIIGAALWLICGGIHLGRFHRNVTHASPAPQEVRDLVSEGGKALGLLRTPETRMVPGHLSPMIWCGGRTRLFLPIPLWSRLDEAGRRAVIFHELAHLRRHDHWVSLIEMVVGLVYWWHPLVWWVRRRLRGEAEMCCDAWVTSLLPHGRRAYAEALLRAKESVRDNSCWLPALMLGVSTGRAGRFARRLTMVMTRNVQPRLSLSGAVLVLTVAGLSWLAAPAQSSPPKEKPEAQGAVSDTDQKKKDTVEERLDRLEGQLDRLTKQLDKVIRAASRRRGGIGVRGRAPREPRAPRAPRGPRRSGMFRHNPPRPGGDGGSGIGDGDQVEVRVYKLPKGKLEALTALMTRSDVPVPVRPLPDGIEVHGPRRQQRVFERFIKLIDPPKDRQSMAQPQFHYTPDVEDFPRYAVQAGQGHNSPARGEFMARLRALKTEVGVVTSAMDENKRPMKVLEEKQRTLEVEKNRLQVIADDLHDRASQTEAQADDMKIHAEDVLDQANALRQEANELQERAENTVDSPEQARKFLEQAQEMERQAREMEIESGHVARESEKVRRDAERIERKAERIESRLKRIERKLERLEVKHDELEK